MSDARTRQIAHDLIDQGKVVGGEEPNELAGIIRDHVGVISDIAVMDVMRELRNVPDESQNRHGYSMTAAELIAELSKWPADAPVELALVGEDAEPGESTRITAMAVTTSNEPFMPTRLCMLLDTAD